MPSLSDFIEEYLKSMLKESIKGNIEIQRSELAGKFNCVPSQINYVINTRFNYARGYLVETKRGGGGYLRIFKINSKDTRELATLINDVVGERVNQQTAENLILRLLEDNHLSYKEAKTLTAACRAVMDTDEYWEEKIRAKVLKAMLLTLLSFD